MPRFSSALAALVAALAVSHSAMAQQPPASLRDAVALAKQRLAEGRSIEAVKILEQQLTLADGDKEFRETLRAAYAAELKQLTDPTAREQARKNLALLGGAPVAEPQIPAPFPSTGALPPPGGFDNTTPFNSDSLPPPIPSATPRVAPPGPSVAIPSSAPASTPAPVFEPAGIDYLKQAAASFNQARTDPAKFQEARDLFSQAVKAKQTLTPEQQCAWAYCRLKVATDTLNRSSDAQTAAELVGEIEDALAIAPDHAGLQNAGRDVLSAARKRAGNLAVSRPKPLPAAEGSWEILDTDNFRLKYHGKLSQAETLARVAEEKRLAIFTRWSAPPAGKWQPKCEIVLHADATSFARATRLAPGSTGRADVTLTNGEPTARRIDLRADDPTLTEDALPRELTHIILADLFPSQDPPKWASLGMAVLSESPEQLGRYRRTVVRCERDGELMTLPKLLATNEIAAKSVTVFAVESVSLVDFLVRWKKEKHFVAFLRDAQRYGVESALKRQYGVADSRELESLWRKNVIVK